MDAAVAIAALGCLGVVAVYGATPPGLAAVACGVALGAAAWWRGGHVGVVGVLCALLGIGAATAPMWQLAMAVAVAGTLVIHRRWPSGWARGQFPVWPTVIAAAVTPGALIGWFLVFRPNPRALLGPLAELPPWALIVGAIGFVVVNALLEEAIWRGVLQVELEPLVGPWAAVALQAVSFGVQHAHGFPRGWVGVGLVIPWALILGALRRYSGGLLAPLAAHAVADAVIAGILLTAVL